MTTIALIAGIAFAAKMVFGKDVKSNAIGREIEKW